MSAIMWLLGLSLLALCLWALAAFVFRLPHLGRLLLTITVPALIAGGRIWFRYLESRVPGENWDGVFLIMSLLVGSFTAMAMLPVWFVAEERLGWRAR